MYFYRELPSKLPFHSSFQSQMWSNSPHQVLIMLLKSTVLKCLMALWKSPMSFCASTISHIQSSQCHIGVVPCLWSYILSADVKESYAEVLSKSDISVSPFELVLTSRVISHALHWLENVCETWIWVFNIQALFLYFLSYLFLVCFLLICCCIFPPSKISSPRCVHLFSKLKHQFSFSCNLKFEGFPYKSPFFLFSNKDDRRNALHSQIYFAHQVFLFSTQKSRDRRELMYERNLQYRESHSSAVSCTRMCYHLDGK